MAKSKKKSKGRHGGADIGRLKSGIRSIAKLAIPWIALVQQTTTTDISTQLPYWNALSSTLKIQYVLHNFIGRVTNGNVNVFSFFGSAPKPTWQFGNMLNKWTGTGIAMMIYGHLPVKGLPERAAARTTGFWTMAAGLLGGLLDDPSSVYNPGNPPSQLNNNPAQVRGGAITRSTTTTLLYTGVNQR